jgi:hypothetical protein
VLEVTRVRAFLWRTLRDPSTQLGFGLGLIAVLLVSVELVAIGDAISAKDPWLAAASATVIGVGMATGLVARGPRGWDGLVAGLVCGAILFGVANSILQPDNSMAQGTWLVAGIVFFAGWWTVFASIGYAVVSVARRTAGPR